MPRNQKKPNPASAPGDMTRQGFIGRLCATVAAPLAVFAQAQPTMETVAHSQLSTILASGDEMAMEATLRSLHIMAERIKPETPLDPETRRRWEDSEPGSLHIDRHRKSR